MKKVEIKNDSYSITIDPNQNSKMYIPGEIELGFRRVNSNGRNIITVTIEDLNSLESVIKKFKEENWTKLIKG